MPDIYLHPHMRAAIGIPDYSRLHCVTYPDGRTEVLVLSDWQKAILIETEPGTVCIPWVGAHKPARTRTQKQEELALL